MAAPSAASRRERRSAIVAFAAAFPMLVGLVPGVARAAPARVPGIDVSKWQLAVDWGAVATTNIRFVIARSTIGDTAGTVLSVDPRYAEYVAGATANGLIVGAYHRANVGRQAGDARREADFFVDLSRIEPGDVLPVLDIEQAHDLSVAELREWVKTWVRRVVARSGVKPMIYTSPYFWRTYLGNATWFANRGYPLWIANWNVRAPDVPAGNWAGRGWTYWQWTSTGSVEGISTDVDRDRFVSGGLLHGTIASLEVAPAAGGTIVGPRIRCGGAWARCERLGNPDTTVALDAVPDPGAIVLRWTGACAGARTAACEAPMLGTSAVSAVFGYPVHVDVGGSGGGFVTSSPAGIDCGDDCDGAFPADTTITLRAAPSSASAFEGWSAACAGSGLTCDVAVTAAARVGATFVSTVSVEEDGPGTRYAWGRARDRLAIGGSFRWERRTGASIAFDVSGRSATLFTVAGPGRGRAQVRVDGRWVDTLDGYARAPQRRSFRFGGLGSGPHELRVIVLGTRRPASTGTAVAIDAVRWAGLTRANPAGRAAWAHTVDAAASGGAYAVTGVAEATARLRFTGTGVSVRLARGPRMGTAEFRVDGELVRVVDLYRPAPAFRTLDLAAGLPDGPHTATVIVLGAHRPASAGSSVGIDRWIVR